MGSEGEGEGMIEEEREGGELDIEEVDEVKEEEERQAK